MTSFGQRIGRGEALGAGRLHADAERLAARHARRASTAVSPLPSSVGAVGADRSRTVPYAVTRRPLRSGLYASGFVVYIGAW